MKYGRLERVVEKGRLNKRSHT